LLLRFLFFVLVACRFHPKKYATPINAAEEDDEFGLLEKKSPERDDVDYVERAKKKIPRVIIALIVLLVLTNVIGNLAKSFEFAITERQTSIQ
jgi:hypothetical protein